VKHYPARNGLLLQARPRGDGEGRYPGERRLFDQQRMALPRRLRV